MAKLLLVEDHPINRKLFVDILSLDHEVVEAPSAEDALSLLAGFAPDLILMDIQLPGMDGLSLTRQLKGQPAFAAVPIVALSAHAMPEEIERAKRAGCIDYITKPITDDPLTLLDRINRHLPASADGQG